MATLVLSSIGTAIGGPVGQAVGAIIGSQVDKALFSSGASREGPRLKELSVTSSSYGQPMARQFGRMRVGGTVIWATDIEESATREGGKGQPSTTTYSYSASFAVALSSSALNEIGRVWADGNLLRGAAGDLKVEGEMRTYFGKGDNPVDPLIAAEKGAQSPAFRDCAYVVFESLALADYGNRIPALTFEVFANDEDVVTLESIVPGTANPAKPNLISHARGFADEGGAVIRSLSAINEVLPLSCVTTANGVEISAADQVADTVVQLPERLASIDDGETRERSNRRNQSVDLAPLAVRYYDEDRDYQPGVQRAIGMRPNGLEKMVDLPATMIANGARQLANENAQRARWKQERITRRIGILDPQFQPGSLVSMPERPGIWRVIGWEWYERGVELELERMPPQEPSTIASDPGTLLGPIDVPLAPTALEFFEAPPDGISNSTIPSIFAAGSSTSASWRGATLFAEQGNTLAPVGSVSADRAIIGQLLEPLAPSTTVVFEPSANVSVELAGDGLDLESTDLTGIAAGANRLLVGSEVIQFAAAQSLGGRAWRLSGLLRGRAGTEDFASEGHDATAKIALLDSRLTAIDTTNIAAQSALRIAAIGRGDAQPVYADLRNKGLSQRPPSPVHPRIHEDSNLDWNVCWNRRARGAWQWRDGVETALIEETERYIVGYLDTEIPSAFWETDTPRINFSLSDRNALVADYGSGPLWVRQAGTYSTSAPLLLAILD